MIEDYQYQIGGSLPEDSPTYVVRQADFELYDGLDHGEFCYVLNSRQMGKSSLLVRTMQKLISEGISCVTIDISDIGNQQVSLDKWYGGVAYKLLSSFELFNPIEFMTWWRERELISPVQRLGELIEEVLLKQISNKIVIFIDEIDSILSFRESLDDFFALIRSCYNKRAQNPEYQRLTFALLGVATPSDLISDRTRTPFNIGKAVNLYGFQLTEVMPLAQGLEGKVNHPQDVLQEILKWTGGQPFLTQKLCKLVIQYYDGQLEENIDNFGSFPLVISKLVKTHIIDNWEAQDQPAHIKTIRDRITKDPQKAGRLLGLYQKILEEGEIATDDTFEQTQLRLSGLVVRCGEKLIVYNSIYATIFDLNWIEKAFFDLRPHAEALAAWLTSNCQDESRLLRGQALQDARNWATGKSMSNQDYQFLAASQEAELADLRLKEEQNQTEIERLVWEKDLLEKLSKEQEQRKLTEVKLEHERKLSVEINIRAIVVLVLFFVMLLEIIWRQTYIDKKNTEIKTLSLYSEALFASNQKWDALLQSIRAGRKMQNFYGITPETRMRVLMALHQSIYSHQKVTYLQHNTGFLSHLTFTSDSQFLATVNEDGSIKLWQRNGKLNKILIMPEQQVKTINFNIDNLNFKVASIKDDGMAKIWQQDGKLLFNLKSDEDPITSLSFSPDGLIIAVGNAQGKVKLWKLNTPELQPINTKEIDHIPRVETWNYTDKACLSGLKDKSAQVDLFCITPGFNLAAIQITNISWSRDGQRFASASADGSVKIWNRDGMLLKYLKAHHSKVKNISFSPNGQTIASASVDGTVKLWNIDGTLLSILKHPDQVTSISFSPDGEMLASGCTDKIVRLWHIDGTFLKALSHHQNEVSSVTFSPDSQMLASASIDGTIILWNFHLDNLLKDGCSLVRNYLKNQPNLQQKDRLLCDGIN